MSLIQNSTAGYSEEGTITAVPTAVVNPERDIYKFLVDTSAGNVSLDAIAAIAGVKTGATLHFKKLTADTNEITFTDNDTTRVVRAATQSDVLSLTWTGTEFDLVG